LVSVGIVGCPWIKVVLCQLAAVYDGARPSVHLATSDDLVV
jgi:hypothetical protein